MIYEYSRINLKQTYYRQMPKDEFQVLTNWDYGELNDIFLKYCRYKKFSSFMPIFYEDLSNNTVLGYFNRGKIVAFSWIIEYPSQLSITAEQFAWDYADPKLRLGIRSLENECSYFKNQGYEYMYLHGADEYKKDFDGFEILGPI